MTEKPAPTDAAHWKAKAHRAEYDEMFQRLTDAAWELARFKGLSRLTLNGVAQQAGCARSSVYRYFDNKEQLLGAVLQQRVLALGRELGAALAEFDDPREQIVRGLYLAVQEVRSGPSLELLGRMLAQEGRAVAELMMDYLTEIAPDMLSLQPVFQDARGAGLVREEVSDEDLLRWLITTGLGLWQQGDQGRPVEEELAFLRKMLLPAIFVAE